MIFTNLDDNQQNKTLSKKIEECIEFVKNENIIENYETGSHYIEKLGVKMNYDNYTSKNDEDGFWESHVKYIDVQIMLDGEEYIAVNNIKNLKLIKEDLENDFLKHEGEELFRVPIKNGDVLVLYPEDVHMPGLKINENRLNKKVVFKIGVDQL